MTEQRLTDELARIVLGWRPAPDRYLKAGRGWTPRSRFRPLSDIRDAFRLLDVTTDDYALTSTPGQRFKAEVRRGARTGQATGDSKPRTISLAIAQLVGVELVPKQTSSKPNVQGHKR